MLCRDVIFVRTQLQKNLKDPPYHANGSRLNGRGLGKLLILLLCSYKQPGAPVDLATVVELRAFNSHWRSREGVSCS